MTLDDYKRKRSAQKTAEPLDRQSHPSAQPIFVVQKHLSKQLHYDLRLEMDGVLKSWAVPKGPSLDPSIKRLAIHVEDHPLSYAHFEGVIPEGQYGAGKMIVWDTGVLDILHGEGIGYAAGNLKFELHGEKLRGRWALVKIRQAGDGRDHQWLLIKERDAYAKSEKICMVTNEFPLSVLTGRDVHQLTSPQQLAGRRQRKDAATRTEQPDSKPAEKELRPELLQGAQPAQQLPELRPQLATASDRSPEGVDWLHEIKLDGYRLMAAKDGKHIQLMTRNGQDWTERFPSVHAALRKLDARSFILDGELVSLRSDGVSDFSSLQSALRENNENKLVYYIFDLLYCNGFDLTNVQLIERKNLLAELLQDLDSARIQLCEHIVGNGQAFFEHCRSMGLEGAISKKSSSRYRSGRSQTWQKRKCILADDFVIVGYTPSQKRKGELRSLVLASYTDNQLSYAGKVGTGFSDAALAELQQRCGALKRKTSPLTPVPAELHKDRVVWIKPELVARVQYVGLTSSNQLRHASFQGLRNDIPADQVGSPTPIDLKVTGELETLKKTPCVSHVTADQLRSVAEISLSNPEKILFPSIQVSKLDVAKYYVAVAERMLAYIEHRPVSLLRFPDGIEQESFFQKHPSEGMHPSISQVDQPGEEKKLLCISNLQALASAVQLASIELHPWSAKADRLDRPDRIIFDLDPGETIAWQQVTEAALQCKQILDQCELESFVKTSGNKGLHVVVPIQRRSGWSDVSRFAKAVGSQMVRQAPELFTLHLSRNQRVGRILIDIHRNHAGSTCVAAFSLRATPTATVSMPVAWQDLQAVADPREFDIETASRIVGSQRQDPWAAFYSIRQTLTRKNFQIISSL
ncbi:MAG: DNA ligase D [bacterium]|nr:DNA ligase D [bacterium]